MSTLSIAFACAWCQRLRTGTGWEPVSAADLNCAGVTHGICQECLDRETEALVAGDVRPVVVTEH